MDNVIRFSFGLFSFFLIYMTRFWQEIVQEKLKSMDNWTENRITLTSSFVCNVFRFLIKKTLVSDL